MQNNFIETHEILKAPKPFRSYVELLIQTLYKHFCINDWLSRYVNDK